MKKNEEVRVDIVVDGVAFSPKGEEAVQTKAILNRRLEENATVEQLDKKKSYLLALHKSFLLLLKAKMKRRFGGNLKHSSRSAGEINSILPMMSR